MTDYRPASRLAREWLTRLLCLEASLRKSPTDTQAWRWRMQAKILSYFLARYGDDPTLDRSWSAQDSTPTASLVYPDQHAAPIRSREFFHRCLAGIAEANRSTRAE